MARGTTVMQPARSLGCPRRGSVAACRSPTQRRHLRPCALSASGCRCYARPSSTACAMPACRGASSELPRRAASSGCSTWPTTRIRRAYWRRTSHATAFRGARLPCAGCLRTRTWSRSWTILRERVDEWIAAATDGPRALDDAALAARAGARGVDMALGGTVPEALDRAAAVAARGDRVVVFGSFHTVGPALEHLGLAWAHGDRSALCV